MDFAALSVLGFFLLYAFFIWCICKTGWQRKALIYAIYDANVASGFGADYWAALDSLSFERHLFRLFTFRNPWKAYVGLPPGFPKVAR